MNVVLPGIDGREATRILRARGETKQIPILAVTALYQAPDRQACIHAGCNDYIIKLVTFDELISKITALAR
jgi:CheY-like chemotaxis protein